ncbi:MAG: SURF1 family protein [Marmoricola sp.]
MPLLLAPRYWGAHLLMVLAVVAAVALGVWQYDAWGARRAAEARDLSDVPAVALDSVITPDGVLSSDDLGRPVEVSGTWLPQSTLFVSDRRHDGRNGFWVMTPVLVGDSALPVIRGWSAEPVAQPVTGAVELTGWMQASEGSSVRDPDPSDDVIPEMRIASIVQRVDADLYSAYVVSKSTSTPAATAGLAQVAPDSIPAVTQFTALRNLLYAFQWWIFAGFAIFIWVRWCRDTLAAVQTEQVASPS